MLQTYRGMDGQEQDAPMPQNPYRQRILSVWRRRRWDREKPMVEPNPGSKALCHFSQGGQSLTC